MPFKVSATFSPIMDPAYTLYGFFNIVKNVMTVPVESSTLVPLNVYATPFIFTVSLSFRGM